VDEAHRVIQRLAVDRQARVLALDEAGGHGVERRRQLQSHDVGARDHHVAHGDALEGRGLIHEVGAGAVLVARRLGLRLAAKADGAQQLLDRADLLGLVVRGLTLVGGGGHGLPQAR
jgi:hypothetical protein